MNSGGSLVVRIPPVIRKILSAELGDSLIFDIAPGRDTVIVAAIKGSCDSAGSRRSG
jgi:antitoxin component of MazEF toxin-antitoxin module